MNSDRKHGDEKVLETLELLEKGIKLGSERLMRLKTNPFFINMFLKEIRDTEQHLINLITRQIIAKKKLKETEGTRVPESYILINEFLKIVGLSEDSIKNLSDRLTFDGLIEMPNDSLNKIISSSCLVPEDVRKLTSALKCLHLCLENFSRDEKLNNNFPLFWNSFDPVVLWSNSFLKPLKSCSQICRKSESSLCNDFSHRVVNRSATECVPAHPFHPMNARSASEMKAGNDFWNDEQSNHFFPISNGVTKEIFVPSKKEEIIEFYQSLPSTMKTAMTNGSLSGLKHRTPSSSSGKHRSLICTKKDGTETPRILRSPAPAIHHNVPHKWTHTYKFTVCNHCNKWIPVVGLRCKECKFKCHIKCEKDVPASCGLPENTLIEYMPHLQRILCDQSSTSCPSRLKALDKRNNRQIPSAFLSKQTADRASPEMPVRTPTSLSSSLMNLSNSVEESSSSVKRDDPSSALHLDKPKTESVEITSPDIASQSPNMELQKNDSFAPLLLQLSIDLDEDLSLKRQVTLSTSLKEWDIPIESITIGNKIHTGSYGTVYRARWHGDVALKIITIDPAQDDAETSLRLFKLEVAMMKKLRHENLVLFCGACLKPPNLGIVTSWINGPSLYNKIHVLNEKLPYNLVLSLAHQIVMAMSYLHSRKFLHKDLRSKNIFVEHNSKAIITDYGLSAANRLCKSRIENMITVPRGWLCYLAPEIIKILHPLQVDLSFTEETDVFAFGTVWYEMLFSQIPFRYLPYESLIWQVGSGINQYLASVKTYKSAKDILVKCWKYEPSKRPKFMELCTLLKKLPNKHRSLARSPSTPSQFHSRSNSIDSPT